MTKIPKLTEVFKIREGFMDNVRGVFARKDKPVSPTPDQTDPDDPTVGKKHRDFLAAAGKPAPQRSDAEEFRRQQDLFVAASQGSKSAQRAK